MAPKLLSYLPTTIAALAAMVLLQACPGGDCVAPVYSVNIPFQVEPAIDTLKVGDTLWVSTRFSDQLDMADGGQGKYANGKFCFSIGVREILPQGNGQPAELGDGNPHVKEIYASGTRGTGSCIVQAEYIDREYVVKLGYKTLKPGIYYLTNGALEAHQVGENKCDTYATTDSYFDVADNRIITLFKQYNLDHEIPTLEREDLVKNMYAFIVVE